MTVQNSHYTNERRYVRRLDLLFIRPVFLRMFRRWNWMVAIDRKRVLAISLLLLPSLIKLAICNSLGVRFNAKCERRYYFFNALLYNIKQDLLLWAVFTTARRLIEFCPLDIRQDKLTSISQYILFKLGLIFFTLFKQNPEGRICIFKFLCYEV